MDKISAIFFGGPLDERIQDVPDTGWYKVITLKGGGLNDQVFDSLDNKGLPTDKAETITHIYKNSRERDEHGRYMYIYQSPNVQGELIDYLGKRVFHYSSNIWHGENENIDISMTYARSRHSNILGQEIMALCKPGQTVTVLLSEQLVQMNHELSKLTSTVEVVGVGITPGRSKV